MGAPGWKQTDDEDTQVLDYVDSMEEDKTEDYDDDFESMATDQMSSQLAIKTKAQAAQQ